jgi:hypothetical protein
VYTVPASTRTILKYVTLYGRLSGAALIEVRAGVAGVIYEVLQRTVGVGTSVEIPDLWIVMDAGDIIRITQSVASSITATFSGAELFI